jgi:hypothetical protein
MFTIRRLAILVFIVGVIVGGLMVLPASAGDRLLTNNANTGNSVWFISDEPSLVMNGFDLTRFGVTTPATIDRVSIDVDSPVPGAPIQLVVYQDANGGSPVDATIVKQAQVDIRQTGVFTAQFNPPITITQPVVWVGFYLPIDFRFRADTSGSSVLTYWAWTDGGRFDVTNLSSAQVLGPGDGSAPVNINMNGIARITAEITGPAGSSNLVDAPILQVVPSDTPDINLMRQYDGCQTLRWDTADVQVSLRDSIDLFCREIWPGFAPRTPDGYIQRQLLYDVIVFDDRSNVIQYLDFKVTHCIEPFPDDLNYAVVGWAQGNPKQWMIMPTVRYGNLVCAEVDGSGLMSYFIPVVRPTPTPPPAPTATATAVG